MGFNIKRYFIVSLFVISSTLSFSQNFYSPKDSVVVSFSDVGLGATLPQGEFQFNYQGNNNNNGYAKTGVCLNLNARTYKRKFIGFILTLNAMLNPVDKSFYPNYSSLETTSFTGKWKNFTFCLGPSLRLPSKNIELLLNLPVGFVATNRPEIVVGSYNVASGTFNNMFTYSSGFSLGLAAIPEILLNFEISKNTKLKLFANYFIGYANVKYNYLRGDVTSQTQVVLPSALYHKIRVTAVNAGIGISFQLQD